MRKRGFALPQSATRLWRDRTSLLGAAVAVLLAGGAASVGATANVRLTGDIAANSRGVYDILVRPAEARTPLEARQRVVEPNFAFYSAGGDRAAGISAGQLARIQNLAGVGVAAPVSVIGYIAQQRPMIMVDIAGSALPKSPTLYRIDVRASTSDGLNTIPLGTASDAVVLGPLAEPESWASVSPGGKCQFFDSLGATVGCGGAHAILHNADGSTTQLETARGDHLTLLIPSVVTFSAPMVAVDPVAEKKLLGESGAFLDPLVATHDKRPAAGFTAATFNTATIVDSADSTNPYWSAAQDVLEARTNGLATEPVFPVIAADRYYNPLTATATVRRVGPPPPSWEPGGHPPAPLPGTTSTGTVLSAATWNLTATVQPLAPAKLTMSVPGGATDLTSFQEAASNQRFVVGPPSFTVTAEANGRRGLQVSAEPLGPVTRDGLAATGANASEPAQQSYREVRKEKVAAAPIDHGTGKPTYTFAPVGTFDVSEVHDPTSSLVRAPLGIYTPPRATFADGNPPLS